MDLSDEENGKIRKLLHTEKVEYEIPRWVLTAVTRRFPEQSYPTAGDALDAIARKLCDRSWYDRAGHIRVGGKDVFVSEPHGHKVTSKMLQGLEEFVNLVDAKFRFSPHSWHSPGTRVRIVIEPN